MLIVDLNVIPAVFHLGIGVNLVLFDVSHLIIGGTGTLADVDHGTGDFQRAGCGNRFGHLFGFHDNIGTHNPACHRVADLNMIPFDIVAGFDVVIAVRFSQRNGGENRGCGGGVFAHVQQFGVDFERAARCSRGSGGLRYGRSPGGGSRGRFRRGRGCGGGGFRRGGSRGCRGSGGVYIDIGADDPAADFIADFNVIPVDIADGLHLAVREGLSHLDGGDDLGGGACAGAHIEKTARDGQFAVGGRGGIVAVGNEIDKGTHDPAADRVIDLDVIPVDAVDLFDFAVGVDFTLSDRCELFPLLAGFLSHVENGAGDFHRAGLRGSGGVAVGDKADKGTHDPAAFFAVDLDVIPIDVLHGLDLGVVVGLPLLDGGDFFGGGRGGGAHIQHRADHFQRAGGGGGGRVGRGGGDKSTHDPAADGIADLDIIPRHAADGLVLAVIEGLVLLENRELFGGSAGVGAHIQHRADHFDPAGCLRHFGFLADLCDDGDIFAADKAAFFAHENVVPFIFGFIDFFVVIDEFLTAADSGDFFIIHARAVTHIDQRGLHLDDLCRAVEQRADQILCGAAGHAVRHEVVF